MFNKLIKRPVTQLLNGKQLFVGLIAASLYHSANLAQAEGPASSAAEPQARSIVEKADQIRFPTEAFQVDVDVVTSRSGLRVDARKYRILSKGNENTIVQLLDPASERGQ